MCIKMPPDFLNLLMTSCTADDRQSKSLLLRDSASLRCSFYARPCCRLITNQSNWMSHPFAGCCCFCFSITCFFIEMCCYHQVQDELIFLMKSKKSHFQHLIRFHYSIVNQMLFHELSGRRTISAPLKEKRCFIRKSTQPILIRLQMNLIEPDQISLI